MPYRFYLDDIYTRTEIEEPKNWDSIVSVLKRDFQVHGVFFNLTDGALKLGFKCDGKTLLENAYDQDGIDAYMKFVIEEGLTKGLRAYDFDETNYLEINKNSELEISQFEIEYGFVDNSDGAAAFQWSIAGDYTGAYGLQLQSITSGSNVLLRLFKGSAGTGVGITTDGGAGNVPFPKGDYHKVRLKYISNSNIQVWADVSESGWVEYLPSNGPSSGTLKYNDFPSIIGNGYLSGSPIYATQEFTGQITYFKMWKIDSLGRRIKELINYDAENSASAITPNNAVDAPPNSNATFRILEQYTTVSNQFDYDEIYSGLIDFSTREYNEDYFNVEVNNSQQQLKLKSKFSQRINLNKSTTLSGLNVGNITYQEISSLAERSGRKLFVDTAQTITKQSDAEASSTSMRGTCSFNVIENIELVEFDNPISQFIPGATSTDWFCRLKKEAALTLKMSWDFDIDLTEDQGSGTTSYTLSVVLISSKPDSDGDTIETIYSNSGSSASPYNFSDTDTNNNHSLIGVLGGYAGTYPKDTQFRIQFLISMSGTGTQQFTAEWTIRKFELDFTDYGVDLATLHRWYHVHDVLNKILQLITDKQDYLYSELLGGAERGYSSDGCLDSLRITNGFRMRQINDVSKAPILSFQDIFNNLNALWGVGYGFETLDSPYELGFFDVKCEAHYVPEIELSIGGNYTYDIFIGDKVWFYNNPDIYGGYTISDVTYDAGLDRTYLWFDYSENENWYYSTDIGSYPKVGTTYSNVYITVNSGTTERERLRLEPWEHFYVESELIDLGTVQEYREEPFDKVIYSQIDAGFKKYANDEDLPSTLEDFHTDSSWDTPIKSIKNILKIVFGWIGSTWLMNESRRTIFDEKPTTSHKLDDDIYFGDRLPREGLFLCTFSNANETITVPAACYANIMRGADYITIDGSASNDGNFVLDYSTVVHLLPADNYKITQDSILGARFQDETVTCTVKGWNNISKLNDYKIEADENLSNTENLSYPAFIANQRRTIKRSLIRWGSFINSFLSYRSNPEIRNTSFVNNGEYTSAIDPYSTVCETDTYQENDNITNLAESKFKPNLIKFTKYICDSDYNNILAAHENNAASNNYGYITVSSPNGNSKIGWLMELKRSPIKKIGNFTLLERDIHSLTIGETVLGSFSVNTTYRFGIKVTAPRAGIAQSISFYFQGTAQNLLFALYDVDGSNQPDNRLAITDTYAAATNEGLVTVPLLAKYNFVENEQMYIAFASSGTYAIYTNGESNDIANSFDSSLSCPDPFGSVAISAGDTNYSHQCYINAIY